MNSEMSNKVLKIGIDLFLTNIDEPYSAPFGASLLWKSANSSKGRKFAAEHLFLFWKSRHAYMIAPIDAFILPAYLQNIHLYLKLNKFYLNGL